MRGLHEALLRTGYHLDALHMCIPGDRQCTQAGCTKARDRIFHREAKS